MCTCACVCVYACMCVCLCVCVRNIFYSHELSCVYVILSITVAHCCVEPPQRGTGCQVQARFPDDHGQEVQTEAVADWAINTHTTLHIHNTHTLPAIPQYSLSLSLSHTPLSLSLSLSSLSLSLSLLSLSLSLSWGWGRGARLVN